MGNPAAGGRRRDYAGGEEWIRAAYPVDGVGGDLGLHWRNIRDEIGEEMSGNRLGRSHE
jgi:hypothetical protein